LAITFLWIKKSEKISVSASLVIMLKYISGHNLMFYFQVILAQEKNIQQLNELIQSLQLQLLHCRGSNSSAQTASSHSEVEGHEMIGD
jgi:hypothetical protein